jgi:hypothetical protein
MVKSGFTVTFTAGITLLLIVAMSVGVHADGPPPEVQRAAEEGLAHFLTTVPAQELARMGLETAEDVRAATLGAPYEQFTITSGALSAYGSGVSLSSLLTSTGAWLFPVMVGGEARTMLTVSKVNGQWEGGDIGGTHLPAALQAAEANLPALLAQEGVTAAYRARFVRVFQVYADFLAVEAGDAEYLLPLMPDPSQFNLAADTLAAPDRVLGQLDALMGPAPQGEAMGGGGAQAVTAEEPTTSSALLFGGAAVLALAVLGGTLVLATRQRRA